MGFKMVDGAGKQVIWNLNGIPNKTDGWERWEWELASDPRAVHGVFSILFIRFPVDGKFRMADLAVIELPPKKLTPYAKGEGATFRGGPGNLLMRVENVETDGEKIEVRTTGALYAFHPNKNTILAKQMLEREREVSLWKSSLGLNGLKILRKNEKECVIANDSVTFGVQCDSLMMVVPHDELILSCKIAGKWNRFACGHMTIIDEYGGMAVNPDRPFACGRLARTHVGRHYAGIVPGRIRPGQVDFSGLYDDQTFLSRAKPGWEVSWHLSPGERLAISIFPPRPFPWKDSFGFGFLLARRRDPLDGYPRRKRGDYRVEILWDFLQRSWAMSWGPRHVAHDDEELRAHVAAIKKAGSHPVVYASPQWYYSRDAEEFAAELKRLKDTYGIEGVYYDGIPSQEWVVAYEEMRMTREVFPDGPVILHATGQSYSGGPPLGEPSLKIPAIETYATATYTGELVYGYGYDWVYPRYVTSQYRKANCIGVMKHDAWEGPTELQQELIMLRHNGRCQYRKYPAESYQVLLGLKALWEEKGDEPDFYERYYLPKFEELTRDLLPAPRSVGAR